MKIRVRREDWSAGIGFVIQDGSSYSTEIKMELHDKGMHVDSVGRMTNEEAQSLIDELWDCGLRPTEGKGSAGSLKATENHLNDMRKIVFKDFGKEAGE